MPLTAMYIKLFFPCRFPQKIPWWYWASCTFLFYILANMAQPVWEEEWEPLVTCRAMGHLPNLHNFLQPEWFSVSNWQTFTLQDVYLMPKTEYRLVNMTALLTFSYRPPKVRSWAPIEILISIAASRVTYLHALPTSISRA